MLGWMRKFVRSKLGFALFVLLLISFGIFFRDPFKGFVGGGFVEVGNRELRQRDVDREVADILERARVEQGKILSPRDAAQQGITQEVLNSLVYRNAVLAYADKIGVKASSSAVNNLLMTNAPRFKDALGRINMDAVKAYASEQRMSLNELLDDLRDRMTLGYVEQAAFNTITTPEILTKPLMSFFGEQRTVSLARLTPTSIPEPKAPTDEELKAWYDKNTQRFAQPERRRISVLSYSSKDYMDKAQASISDAQVKTEYDRRIQDFSTPATREVAQFTGPDRNTLQTFVDTVKQGVSLEDALKRVPGITRVNLTGLKSGDLKDKQYNDFVFGIPQNQVMGPIQVGEVWYVVQVNKIIPGVATPLEKVADKIRESLAGTEASRLFKGSEETFYDMAGGASLEQIGAQIGAPTLELPPVDGNAQTRHGGQPSPLTAHPEAVRTLFTLSAGQMTDVIEGDGERSIYRLDEIIAPRTLTFEEAKADVRTYYLAQKVQEAADKVAADMVAAVKAGKTFEQAATTSKMTALGALPLVRGMQAQIDPNVFTAAFKQPVGETAVVKGQGGEPWVMRVEKSAPASDQTAVALKTQLEADLSRSLEDDLREVFVRGVQKEVPVKPNEGAIEAYFKNLTKNEAQ